jgi:hypothetical protein
MLYVNNIFHLVKRVDSKKTTPNVLYNYLIELGEKQQPNYNQNISYNGRNQNVNI